jgi:hypothetical protein
VENIWSFFRGTTLWSIWIECNDLVFNTVRWDGCRIHKAIWDALLIMVGLPKDGVSKKKTSPWPLSKKYWKTLIRDAEGVMSFVWGKACSLDDAMTAPIGVSLVRFLWAVVDAPLCKPPQMWPTAFNSQESRCESSTGEKKWSPTVHSSYSHFVAVCAEGMWAGNCWTYYS